MATGFSAALLSRSCVKTCVPSQENAGQTGTSRSPNLETPGNNPGRNCFTLTPRKLDSVAGNSVRLPDHRFAQLLAIVSDCRSLTTLYQRCSSLAHFPQRLL